GERTGALSAYARHAEPPHHRSASVRSRDGGAAYARIQFDDRAVLAHTDRQMVVDHAAQPRRDLRLRRADPGDPYRPAGRPAYGRAGRRAARAAYSAGYGAAGRGDDAGERVPHRAVS